MKDKSIIAAIRTVSGAAILITSMVTGIDGQMQLIALFLMGIPLEMIPYAKEKTKEEA